ncbi:hypothetical protein VTN96DRAFT_3281 [Rasamsonia emersonii]
MVLGKTLVAVTMALFEVRFVWHYYYCTERIPGYGICDLERDNAFSFCETLPDRPDMRLNALNYVPVYPPGIDGLQPGGAKFPMCLELDLGCLKRINVITPIPFNLQSTHFYRQFCRIRPSEVHPLTISDPSHWICNQFFPTWYTLQRHGTEVSPLLAKQDD